MGRNQPVKFWIRRNSFSELHLTFDWYNKKTTGILQIIVLPGYAGSTGTPWGNVADMENRSRTGTWIFQAAGQSYFDLREMSRTCKMK